MLKKMFLAIIALFLAWQVEAHTVQTAQLSAPNSEEIGWWGWDGVDEDVDVGSTWGHW